MFKMNNNIRYIVIAVSVIVAGASLATSGRNINSSRYLSTVDTSYTQPTKAPMLVTDFIQWSDSVVLGKCKACVSMKGEYPIAGTTRLVDSVRNWLASKLGKDLANAKMKTQPAAYHLSNGNRLVSSIGEALLRQAYSDFTDYQEDDFSLCYEFNYEFEPVYETENLLTYRFSGYAYWGGAHGSTLCSGQTFIANTGCKLDSSNIFLPETEKEVIELIKSALWEQYFKKGCDYDGSLKDALLINPDDMKLPSTPPLFGKDGITFIYQEYEIACYAAGAPTCVLPYSAIRQFLRKDVVCLIDE